MATLDEIFAAMPEAAAEDTHEVLYIDPATRQIDVPDAEAIFGVESDGRAERKYFACPRYVGAGVDLAACFLRVNYRNANNEVDAYLVQDAAVKGEYVTFSWELTPKVTSHKGKVQFIVCAILPGSNNTYPEWNTTLASGEVLEGLEPDGAAAEAATADVIAQLLALVAKQSDNVEAVGAAQVAAVQAEGNTQVSNVKAAAAQAQADAVQQIEAKGANTLATIPEDYTTLDSQVDKLTRTTAGAIVCQAAGETIQVHDASDHHLLGLRIFGRSTQDGTPTPDAPVEIVSLPAPTVGVYGKNICPPSAFDTMASSGKEANTYDATSHTITMDADPTTAAGRYCVPCRNFVIGQSYVVSFDLRGTTGKKVRCGWDSNHLRITLAAEYVRYSAVVVATRANEPIIFYSAPAADGGLTAGEFMQFNNVQIEVSAVATEYEPYKDVQTLATTPGSLPGIPVASGGNYTDANGQQWICDEVDLGRGVYVQRVETVTYDGTGETWFKSTNGEDNYLYHVSIKQEKAPGSGACFCNRLQRKTTAEIQLSGNALEQVGISPSPKYNVMYVNIGYYLAENTAEAMAAYLAENPLIVQYALANPVEIALDDVTLAAFRELHSNKPTTTLLNDAGAYMIAEYVADTKLYIDRKIAELVAANNT